ncbi:MULTISPECIES: TetR/AcrR family transcriptional regulator [Paenibacillus]|jgi:AcrR family transcriptional regulator|uniref:TetR/AcrR family transcriptional regulator n=1 Tax=Paenibacillus TaxID=44249 RepID=UPI00096EC3DE|nr:MULTISPECIES: TetR/AcrR family transcriptional regulator [Paenibacillus]MCP3747513.1 TetR/AcrR family transcriptional regulator [Paenibacillus sp. A3M_27_13]OMF72959.1 TetR family transcriptional regulator [Paenibacillus peoriae]
MSRPREFDVDRVLQQTMEVFWNKGFKSTSYEDLTRTTGVKKQSLYGVFNDKRSLFLKALVHYREQYIEILEKLEAQEMSPVNKLESLRDSLLDEEATSRGCLMVNSALEFGTEDDQVTREIELMFTEAEQILEKIVISGQEQQLITTRFSSEELASYLNNAILGARIQEKSGASREQIKAILRVSFSMILP